MKTKTELTIGGVELEWDIEKGQVLFERNDVVFFWVKAMKTFFDSIKEISGEEVAKLVLETTGFRQGLVVGEGFKKLKNIDVSNVVEWLTGMYASAGWGLASIEHMNNENNTFILHIKNDWEYKLNRLEEPPTEGIFVPAHFAGVFTGLFGKGYWYRVQQYQDNQNEYSIVEYFLKNVNIERNIHHLARKKEADVIRQLEQLVEEKTKVLQDLIRELSSPIIPVLDGIVVVPLIGTYDEYRVEDLIRNTLTKLPKFQANYLLLDVTGLNKELSEHTIGLIEKLGSAATLLGTETILVGVSAELAIAIIHSQTNLRRFECLQTLQHGIYYALGKSGRSIV